ncbi:MAG: toxin-antitoxin system YwqK family antitoxin [Flavobacteriales bacterium]
MNRSKLLLAGASFLLLTGCNAPDKEPEKKKEKSEKTRKEPLFEKDAKKRELIRYPNGNKKMMGKYRNGKRHGVWSSWYKDGSLRSELRYENGKRHGFYKTWYKNGKLRYKGQYHHGERSGTWTFYNRKGEVIRTKSFERKEAKGDE